MQKGDAMFEHSIRALLLLQIVFLVAPLIKKMVINKTLKRWDVLRTGIFICMIGIIFCDVRLLPEVLGAMLVLLNFLITKAIRSSTSQFPATGKCALFASLAVFILSFVWRSGVLARMPEAASMPHVVMPYDGKKSDMATTSDVILASDLCKKVKVACDIAYGAGSFEKANVEKRETDSAYCFALTFPGGTNCTIRVMKKDGKVICDKAPKASEERSNDV